MRKFQKFKNWACWINEEIEKIEETEEIEKIEETKEIEKIEETEEIEKIVEIENIENLVLFSSLPIDEKYMNKQTYFLNVCTKIFYFRT